MQRFMHTALLGILYFAIISYYIKNEKATEKLQNYRTNRQVACLGRPNGPGNRKKVLRFTFGAFCDTLLIIIARRHFYEPFDKHNA